MHIRVASETDIPEMHRVRMSVRENQLSNPALVQPDHYRSFLNERGRGWVAEVEGRIAGFAIADRTRSNVWALFVDSAFEGRGVGRQLHAVMMDWLFATGVQQVWLSTDRGTRAERFYRSAGWRYAGREPNGEDRYEMPAEDWLARTRASRQLQAAFEDTEPRMNTASTLHVKEIIEQNNVNAVQWYASGDIDSLASMFAEDAWQMPPNSAPLIGRESIRRFWRDAVKWGKWEFMLQALEVSVSGPIAVERGKYSLQFTAGAAAPPGMSSFQDRGHYLVHWRLEPDGRWRVVSDAPVSEMPR